MARINLLPWRAELRREQRIRFLSVLAVAAVLAAMAVGAVHLYYDQKIAYHGGFPFLVEVNDLLLLPAASC